MALDLHWGEDLGWDDDRPCREDTESRPTESGDSFPIGTPTGQRHHGPDSFDKSKFRPAPKITTCLASFSLRQTYMEAGSGVMLGESFGEPRPFHPAKEYETDVELHLRWKCEQAGAATRRQNSSTLGETQRKTRQNLAKLATL